MSNYPITKWDQKFLDLAKLVSTWSKDPSTGCGAVITRPDNTIVSLGFNGFPRNMYDAHELLNNREEKYKRMIHAEMNAILNTRENLQGCSIYTYPWTPCDRCMSHISQSGIVKVVTYKPLKYREWIEPARQIAKECGLILKEYDYHIDRN